MDAENTTTVSDPVNDALAELFRAAAQLSDIASKVHLDDKFTRIPTQQLDLTQLARRLASSLDALGAVRADADGGTATAGLVPAVSPEADLANACRRLGQDLVLRMEYIDKAKVEDVEIPNQLPHLDLVVLRRLWSVDDAKALLRRARALAIQWRRSDPTDWIQIVRPLLARGNAAAIKERDAEDTNIGLAGLPVGNEAPPSGDGAKELFSKPKPSSRAPSVPVGILNDFILENLAYKSMFDREEEITKAHAETLKWIFHERAQGGVRGTTSKDLINFFHTDDLGPIYWITGKPGSGKSTMTQYLFQHQAVMTLLQAWAGKHSVSKAGFFFWTSGSRDQRSQTGLLRSLLYQLLSDNPELLAKTFPELWTKLVKSTTKERIMMVLEWPLEELMRAFTAFLEAAAALKTKVCLFIDGLDEFEGNHTTIIRFFQKISSGTGAGMVKICLSSRPWNVFECAFKEVHTLKVQDVTLGDMMQYSRDKLLGKSHVAEVMKQWKGAGEFNVSLVKKADGVFLWTRLAVDRICETFAPGSDPENLQRILDTLPKDLDALFAKFIFEDQTDSQLSESAAIFQLVRAREVVADFIRDESSNSLTCWELLFALDGRDDKHALEWEVEQAGIDLIKELCGQIAYRVLQRFSGLLTLHAKRRGGNLTMSREAAIAEKRVTYVHRTVRDWLMQGEGIYDRLTSRVPPGFDPNLNLLRSYVLRLKRPVDEIEHHRRLDDWWPDIALAMTHARYAAVNAQHDLQRSFVNELDRTLSWYWRTKLDDPYDHWARNAFGAYEVRMKATPNCQPFLCLATKFGLTRYVCEEVAARIEEESGQSLDGERLDYMVKAVPLLSYATEYLCSRNKTIYPLSDPQLIRGLVRLLEPPSHTNKGPNHEYLDFETRKPTTTWLTVLKHLRTADRRGWIEFFDTDPQGLPRWVEIVKVLIEEGGADVHAVVVKDAWDSEITALGVLELLETKYGSMEVRRLREWMMTRMNADGKGVMESSQKTAMS